MTTFFTSDTHFGHANIIKYCHRPWQSADEMDRYLMNNWCSTVGPNDDVWHLGDFTFRGTKSADAYLKRLPGRKHLIWGNHDDEATRQLPGWTSSQPYAEVRVDGQLIILCHYAMRVWRNSHKGSLHFFGHSHGDLPGNRQSVDVGVDNPAWGYRPVKLQEILRYLITLPSAPESGYHDSTIEEPLKNTVPRN